jgi:pyrroline-5-carboxylate reductase
VKPQNVKTVAANLDGSSLDDTLLVSIMAGVTIDELKSEFKTDRIVRSMPNTPAAILEGITVWTVSTLDYTPGYTGQA